MLAAVRLPYPLCMSHVPPTSPLDDLAKELLGLIRGTGSTAVLERLDRIENLIVAAHRAEIRRIDQETTELGAQLTALAESVGAVADEATLAKIRGLTERLNGIGATPVPLPNSDTES